MLALFAGLFLHTAIASIEPAPPREMGSGPYERLILRGGILVDGTGAPAIGPVDIVIEDNRIVRIANVGSPGAPIKPDNRPKADENTHELDVSGMYILPGFVDMHGHIGGDAQGVPAEYVFKLWLGHGITTIRDPGSGNGLDWVLEHKRKSAENTIVAPRIQAYVFFGMGRDKPISTPEQAREWVREIAAQGADGIKFFGARPDIMQAALDEAQKHGLRSAMHHAQMDVARATVLDTARWGLTTMEHWYGLPEALFTDKTVQDYPANYNYANEYHRFAEAGRLWAQAAKPGSDRWNYVRDELIALDFTIDPTFTIYEATRNVMAARRAEWHDTYTHPALWDFFKPSRTSHGSFWFNWTTADEIAWKDNFRRWMQFVNDYKNHGGRVTVGSDAGYIYKIYGFGYINELEMLQEAGFHPLEVVRSATLYGAQALGMADKIGSVEVGKLADLVIVDANPLANFKVLYGTGAIALNENNEIVRTGGVKYTIKDGIIYDAAQLRADVREIVRKAKSEAGIEELAQPGLSSH
ncbi:MAG TPA: amidohydrolase family protein [Gammaproteobacteria bacterium]|nr:amidohydrolase family protein [Gammaproteobacteria bacterium]